MPRILTCSLGTIVNSHDIDTILELYTNKRYSMYCSRKQSQTREIPDIKQQILQSRIYNIKRHMSLLKRWISLLKRWTSARQQGCSSFTGLMSRKMLCLLKYHTSKTKYVCQTSLFIIHRRHNMATLCILYSYRLADHQDLLFVIFYQSYARNYNIKCWIGCTWVSVVRLRIIYQSSGSSIYFLPVSYLS